MKKTAAMLLALLIACAGVLAAAEESYVPADPDLQARTEDYAGAWVCLYAGWPGNMMKTADHLEDLYVTEAPIMKIEGTAAVFTGLTEMGTDPVPLTEEEDGALSFIPEENVKVFTLRLLHDGVIAMKFNMIEFAPVFYFFPADAEAAPAA